MALRRPLLPIVLTASIAADAGRSIDRHWCPDSEVRIIVPQPRLRTSESKDASNSFDLVWLWFRSSHFGRAARMMRTSETATLILVFRLPIRGAFGKEIEEVPDRAEIVTRSERCVHDPDDFFALFLEHGHARQPAVVAPIAHVGGEGGIAMRHHAEAPAARCLEFLLRLRIVGRRDGEGGAILDVRQQAVETVRP